MTIKRIVDILNKTYGAPPIRKVTNPIDVLVETVLSQNTTDKNSHKAFRILKEKFKSWDRLLKTDTRRVAGLIRSSGLANIKARRIKAILKEIKRREGRIGLRRLEVLDRNDALRYLESLDGVGPKTAACVLLFGFGKPAMPVDTHIYRVATRLGLIKGGVRVEEAHKILTDLVPKSLIYEFHLGIISHGRKTCKAKNPRCRLCALYALCAFPGKRSYAKKGVQR
jgi:endonuclease-3